MNKLIHTFVVALIILLSGCTAKQNTQKAEIERLPNIIIIYADDLGYGDVGCYGSVELETPNIDKLAAEGIRFTSGYCTSATCTPSRYGMLTGNYPWKNKDAQILPGDAPLLITPGTETLPSMLQQAGYHTGIVGKWHLGLGNGKVDWNSEVKPGPRHVGFDYEYIMAATNDRVPTVYLENGIVQGLDPNDPIEVSYAENFKGEPTALTNPELLTKQKWSHGHNMSVVNGIGRIGFMKGGQKARWIDENMADTFLVKAQQYLHQHKDEPFFLYYALHQPHVPRVPHPRFAGTTGLGPRGDVIAEADWCIGQLLNTLEELGLAENTLVIFSSDNGAVLDDGYYDDAVTKIGNHKPLGPLRGGKYSLYDGGTRVPFIVRWKGKINPKVSDALICQIDFKASIAELIGAEIEPGDGENLLPVLLGNSDLGRDDLVLEAMGNIVYRNKNHVLILPHEGPERVNEFVMNETGNSPVYQLYDLSADIGQQINLAEQNPELVEVLGKKFEALVNR